MFGALAHPARRHVLQVLHARGGRLTAGELARRFSHSWPTTTRHLRVLEAAGLVAVDAVGRERHFSLEHKRLRLLLDLWCSGVGLTVTDRHTPREGADMSTMDRLEEIVAGLPEATRVDVEAWGGEPTFRVGGKNFVFAGQDGTTISVKLPKGEAAALVATDAGAVPTGYGLGRHGWVSITLGTRPTRERWREVEEWIRTSYTLVAPKRLARQVLDSDRP
jgi:DNA-binding transcriptional ArsR family regulator/predicted DNA-binding protein (MmcQ/YjbR family)